MVNRVDKDVSIGGDWKKWPGEPGFTEGFTEPCRKSPYRLRFGESRVPFCRDSLDHDPKSRAKSPNRR